MLCVDDVASGDYVQVTGTATLIEGDAVREPTLDICRKYMAEEHARGSLAVAPRDGTAGDHRGPAGPLPVARPDLTGSTRTSAKAPWAELSERPSFGAQTSSSNGSPGTATPSMTRLRPPGADHHRPDVLGVVEAAALAVDPERRIGRLPAGLDLVVG